MQKTKQNKNKKVQKITDTAKKTMLRNWHAQRNRQQLSSVAQNIQLNQPINT